MTVAALYVDPRGVYAGLPDVEVWDEARDARTYPGPWPVVAHPPCANWSMMGLCNPLIAHKRNTDDGCFAAALEAVRTWGGVLEHPAYTRAWRHFGLPRPTTRGGWTRSLLDHGWSCVVDQAMYGHPARKPTWLFYVGPEPPPALDSRGFTRRAATVRDSHGYVVLGTPSAFRDVLLAMARSAAPPLAPPCPLCGQPWAVCDDCHARPEGDA